MRYFFDTEFIEDGRTIDLISIGMKGEDGREFYACNLDCDLSKANEWVKENVFPHLPSAAMHPDLWLHKGQIKEAVLGFAPPDEKPEFWAYFADYDWVVFCQLFGLMIDLPDGYPMWCRDLKQLMAHFQIKKEHLPPSPDNKHDALADACWNRDVFLYLASLKIAPNIVL